VPIAGACPAGTTASTGTRKPNAAESCCHPRKRPKKPKIRKPAHALVHQKRAGRSAKYIDRRLRKLQYRKQPDGMRSERPRGRAGGGCQKRMRRTPKSPRDQGKSLPGVEMNMSDLGMPSLTLSASTLTGLKSPWTNTWTQRQVTNRKRCSRSSRTKSTVMSGNASSMTAQG
jgi:hypothetical protein